MDFQIYSIYDRITHNYGQPILCVNFEDCKRRLVQAYKDNPFVADLDLYCIGVFSTENGVIIAEQSPVFSLHISELFQEVSGDE